MTFYFCLLFIKPMATTSSSKVLLPLLLLLLLLQFHLSSPRSPRIITTSSTSTKTIITVMRDKLPIPISDARRATAVGDQSLHEGGGLHDLDLVGVGQHARHKPHDVAHRDAQEVGQGRPAEEDVEGQEDPREVDPAEPQAEHEAHVLVGELLGPVVDDYHEEGRRQDGHFQEKCAEPEEGEARDEDPGVVGGPAEKLALLELARVLVEGEHVHEEGKPEGVEEHRGEESPELKSLENVGLGKKKLVGVQDVEAVEKGLDEHPGSYRSRDHGLLFPPPNKVGFVVPVVVVIIIVVVIVIHHFFKERESVCWLFCFCFCFCLFFCESENFLF